MDWGQRITPTGDSGNPYLSPKGEHSLGLNDYDKLLARGKNAGFLAS
ncbi:hypothetical protein [Leptolyngbya sp. PCC 6406]|nr:hypothetical protein [Leptolyngbya sp. PCC 6406]